MPSPRAATFMCMQLDLQEHGGDVAYSDVLEALIQYNFRKNDVAVGSQSFRHKAERLIVAKPPSPPSKPEHLLTRQQTAMKMMTKEACRVCTVSMTVRADREPA